MSEEQFNNAFYNPRHFPFKYHNFNLYFEFIYRLFDESMFLKRMRLMMSLV